MMTHFARVDAKEWALQKGQFVFELPTRSHGEVKELFPGDSPPFRPALRTNDAARQTARP